MNILLIEPDIKLGKIYSQFISTAGHTVNWRTTAQASLHSIDKSQPDVIILELQLPTHNGIEFLYELRSYKDWQAIPVIIHSQVPPFIKAIGPMLWDQLGVNQFLYKPATKLHDLSAALEKSQLKYETNS